MKKVVLSICMMIKNEEKNLKRCLDSLQPLRESISSELIIVDTGSEDRSVEIAKEYTDKVYFHAWNDDFSGMRNITISYAKGEWVFIIDGDEVLETTNGILQFLHMPKAKNIAGAALIGKSVTSDKENQFASIITPRIFRRTSTFRYEGIVHNRPVIEGNIVDTGDSLLHYGYIADDKELMERKFKRTSVLLKNELKKDPKNIYYWYQLGISYAMYKNWQIALPMLSKAYDLIKDEDLKTRRDHVYVYGPLLLAYAMNKDIEDEVIEIALEGISIEPNYVDLHFYLAQIYIQKADYFNAEISYLKYLELIKKIEAKKVLLNPLITNYTLQKSTDALYNLASIFLERKDYAKSKQYFQKLINEYFQEASICKDAYMGLARVNFRERNYDELLNLYEKLSEEKNSILLREVESFFEKELRLYSTEEQTQYMRKFSSCTGIYNFLNRVRVKEEFSDNELPFLKRDWTVMPIYYAPIWMYSLKCYDQLRAVEIEEYWSGLSEEIVIAYMKYLVDDYSILMGDIFEKSIAALASSDHYQVLRIRKNILKFLIFSSLQYRRYFKEYVECGVQFINALYRESIICNEWVSDLKNVEEVFLLYMSLAEKGVAKDRIEYLNKAKDVFPEMKEGIRLLLEEMLEKTPVEKIPVEKARDQEMDNLKQTLLAHIRELMNAEKFYEALQVIEEAEQIIGKDLEILALKSEIAVKNS